MTGFLKIDLPLAQEPDENELRVVSGGDLEENHPENDPDYDPYEDLTKYEKDALLYDPDTNCYFNHWCELKFPAHRN